MERECGGGFGGLVVDVCGEEMGRRGPSQGRDGGSAMATGGGEEEERMSCLRGRGAVDDGPPNGCRFSLCWWTGVGLQQPAAMPRRTPDATTPQPYAAATTVRMEIIRIQKC